MKLKAAIFDMDGTVVDSMPMWRTLGSEFLISIGRKPEPDVDRRLLHMHLEEVLTMFAEEYDVNMEQAEVTERMFAIAGDYYDNRLTYKPGVEKVLRELKEAGVRMGIATATNRPIFEHGLLQLGAGEYFDEILTCEEAGANKDHPDVYIQMMEMLGGTLDDSLVFEDHPRCVRTASEAGFKVIGIYDEMSLRDLKQDSMREYCNLYLHAYDEWPGLPGLGML